MYKKKKTKLNLSPANLAKIKEAEAFVHKWCQKKKKPKHDNNGKKSEEVEEPPTPPEEWRTAYFMKPWVDLPDRPAPK